MNQFARRILYGRGLNIAAQINPSRKSVSKFTEIEQMSRVPIKKLGCGFLQSYYLLDDGSFVKTGYFMDSLTSIRIINMHRLVPFAVPIMQKLVLLGKMLSFRGGDEMPTIFNKDIQSPFEDVIFGGCRVFGFTRDKQVYAMGQNYFAQLGTRNITNFQYTFTKISDINNQKIIGVGCGFQHTLFITDNGNLYGCGKASDYQIQPMIFAAKNELTDKIEIPEAMMKGQTFRKVVGGLKFSLVWTDKNKLFAIGHNKFGQCGQNCLVYPQVKSLTQILFEWDKDEQILDIASGFCHSLILTNKFVYFFGSIEQDQNPFATFNQNICAPMPLPIKNPVKIFASFDRSAIISSDGKAYIFGGKDYSYCGGQNGKLQILQGFCSQSQIGLGFSHTLIYP